MAILTDQAGISLLDMAGALLYDQLGAPSPPSTPAFSKLTAMTLIARVQYTSSFTSTVRVGTPIQGNMRQLALARWNYMYPS